MKVVKKINNHELDILDFVLKIWEHKLKIFLITSLTVIVLFYAENKKTISINAITELKPISSIEDSKYSAFRNYLDFINMRKFDDGIMKKKIDFEGLSRINKAGFLNRFVETLKDKEILIDGITKFKLVKRENYTNEDAYKIAVEKLASKINLYSIERENEEKVYKIRFKVKNQNIWRRFLKFIDEETNKKIKNDYTYLKNSYIMNEKNFLKFAEEDIKNEVDYNKKNKNLINNKKLSFLKEQANIARALDIKSNSNFVMPYNHYDNNFYFDLSYQQQNDNNYYLRGYLMIEKQIELIEARNKDSYNEKVLLGKFEEQRSIRLRDIERLDMLFKETPLNSNNFKAAIIDINSTNYQSNQKKPLKTILTALLIGLLISFLYVISIETIGNRLKVSIK